MDGDSIDQPPCEGFRNMGELASTFSDYRADSPDEVAEFLSQLRLDQMPDLFRAFLATSNVVDGVGVIIWETMQAGFRYWAKRDREAAMHWIHAELPAEHAQELMRDWLGQLAEEDFDTALKLGAETLQVKGFGRYINWPDAFYQLAADRSQTQLVELVEKTAASNLGGYWGPVIDFPESFDFAAFADAMVAFESRYEALTLSRIPQNFLKSWARVDYRSAYAWHTGPEVFRSGWDNFGSNGVYDFYAGFCEGASAATLAAFAVENHNTKTKEPYEAVHCILRHRQDVAFVDKVLDALPASQSSSEHARAIYNRTRGYSWRGGWVLVRMRLLSELDPTERLAFVRQVSRECDARLLRDILLFLGHSNAEITFLDE